ncbi:MAG: TolC family protein [Candidatus Eisenbacteria sp.]|nr:TolC family protein [Candidatus Eisenbacteria bacterium]
MRYAKLIVHGKLLGRWVGLLSTLAPSAALAVAALALMPGLAAGQPPSPAPALSGETIIAIPGATESLALASCIQAALESNAELQAVREGRGELAGQMVQARAIGLPTLDLSGTWTRGRDPSFAFDQTFGGGSEGFGDSALDSLLGGISFIPSPEDIPAQTFWRTSLNAHWELQPTLIYNAISAAGLGIRRQEILIADAEQKTTEAVMNAYHAAVLAGESVAALDADLAAKAEFLETTRHRLRLGLSTPLDTLRAAVGYANLLPQRRSAEQRLRDAGANLNVLIGRPAYTPIAVETDAPLELEVIDPDLAVTAVTRRPDISELDVYQRILHRSRGAIKSEHHPSLAADASYGYVTGELPELTDEGHDFWSASVTLKVPLFDGLRTKGRIQEAEAQIRRARLQCEEALRRARLEILSILGDLEAARRNHAAAKLNRIAADDALTQVSLRYELGKADYISVLDVQADRLLAQSNRIQARNEVLTLTASLKRAMGFAPTVPLRGILDALRRERAEESPD